ncbi:MAG: LemA family protein [Candidatus Eisenbacteria bacterium]|nr:LemA family protein [Candidatus Eisenbacteria bacterium]
MPLLIIVAIAALLAVAAVIGIYNALVALRQRVRSGWSQIQVMLKRRHDLIPNLVETVKGYAGHERETLERVIAARGAAVSAGSPAQLSQAEGVLTGALGRLFALAESYPELKADQSFRALQAELASTEEGVAGARSGYNQVVTEYNTRVQSFPAVLLAGAMGFQAEEYFELESAAEKETPKVRF